MVCTLYLYPAWSNYLYPAWSNIAICFFSPQTTCVFNDLHRFLPVLQLRRPAQAASLCGIRTAPYKSLDRFNLLIFNNDKTGAALYATLSIGSVGSSLRPKSRRLRKEATFLEAPIAKFLKSSLPSPRIFHPACRT